MFLNREKPEWLDWTEQSKAEVTGAKREGRRRLWTALFARVSRCSAPLQTDRRTLRVSWQKLQVPSSLLPSPCWPRPLVSPETKATARRKTDVQRCAFLCWCDTQKESVSCKNCSAAFPRSRHRPRPTYFWLRVGSAPGSASGGHMGLDRKVLDNPELPLPNSQPVMNQPWEEGRWAPALRNGSGAWARHQEHPDHGVHQDNQQLAAAPAKWAPCAEPSGPPARGSSPRGSRRELRKSRLICIQIKHYIH